MPCPFPFFLLLFSITSPHISIHNHLDLVLMPSHKTPDFVQNDDDKPLQEGALSTWCVDWNELPDINESVCMLTAWLLCFLRMSLKILTERIKAVGPSYFFKIHNKDQVVINKLVVRNNCYKDWPKSMAGKSQEISG